jgi:hypothetical protein
MSDEPDDDGAWIRMTPEGVTLEEELAAIADRMAEYERVNLADLARQLEADNDLTPAEKIAFFRYGAAALHTVISKQITLMQDGLVQSLNVNSPDTTH